MHPLALAESGWAWVGAGSRLAGLRKGRAIPGLRSDAALSVQQNTRQGREGRALPNQAARCGSQKLILLGLPGRHTEVVASSDNGQRQPPMIPPMVPMPARAAALGYSLDRRIGAEFAWENLLWHEGSGLYRDSGESHQAGECGERRQMLRHNN